MVRAPLIASLFAALSLLVAACAAPATPAPAAPREAPTQAEPTPTTAPAPAEPTAVPTPAEQTTPAAATPQAQPLPPEAVEIITYIFDQAQTEASFTLSEELFGQPTVVKGVTNKVEGSIQANYSNPAQSVISQIVIEAADFKTDSNQRNGAIRRFILQTDQHPKIVFQPNAMEGMPAQIKPGEQLLFKVTGNLTIRDITRPVTFEVQLNVPADPNQPMTGTATTVVKRGDFNLNIPAVPGVANVSEEVTLALNFVAVKQ
ncbi:MAG: YceI family protein [Anaerolineae bacterium]|nr:YceI family protein [Anaerolineae bacterium]